MQLPLRLCAGLRIIKYCESPGNITFLLENGHWLHLSSSALMTDARRCPVEILEDLGLATEEYKQYLRLKEKYETR